MIAQIYDGGLLRIFDNDGEMICDMWPGLDTAEADKHLRKLRLRRRAPWKKCSWGYEARLRFEK